MTIRRRAEKSENHRKLLSGMLMGFYNEFLRPRIENETDFELRKRFVDRIRKFLANNKELAEAAGDSIEAILEDLNSFPVQPPKQAQPR